MRLSAVVDRRRGKIGSISIRYTNVLQKMRFPLANRTKFHLCRRNFDPFVFNDTGDFELIQAPSICVRRNCRPLQRLGAVLLALTLIAGCASTQAGNGKGPGPGDEVSDPIEPWNRAVFNFNLFLDDIIGRPLAEAYRAILPAPARDSVRNFLRNLKAPVILANDLLQGEGKRAHITTMRFLINSTLGIAGLFDVAFDMGYSYHNEDFGQTLAVFGFEEGPYLVFPILGPSTVRAASGKAVDTFINPLTYAASANDYEIYLYGLRGIEGVDFRSRNIETLDQLKRDALDYYSLIRSIYRQHRQNEIRNGKPQK